VSPYLVWVVTSKLFNCFEIDLLVRPKQIEIGCVASSNFVDYGMVVGLLQHAKNAINSGFVYYLLVGAAVLAITNMFIARSERLKNAKA
jgi:hypothetical protein